MGDPEKYISEDEFTIHNKKDDLWISIGGKIYDVTDWVDDHPGGDLPLLYSGGQDVSNVFLAYHPITCHAYLDKFFTGYYIKDYKTSEMCQDYRNLLSEFQKMGLYNKKGHGMLIQMIIALMLFCVSVYGVISSSNYWVQLACGVLLGFSWIQFGFVLHDSAHYQTMLTPALNQFALFIVSACLTGISPSWWKRDHDAHHIATNSLEFDPDTQFFPALAQSSKCFLSLKSYFYSRKLNFNLLTKYLVSYQNFTYLPLVVILRGSKFVEGLILLLSKKHRVPYRTRELFGLLVFWIWFSLLVSSLPDPSVRVTFVAVTFIVVGIQSLQISLNHFSCAAYIGRPKGNEWLEKQTTGSLNIACSPWMDWFHGGLQFQIEHHLFPRIPRCQLRKISPIVKELCKKHNLPYNCANSFWDALMMTLSVISDVALEARNYQPRSSPVLICTGELEEGKKKSWSKEG